MKNPTEQRSLSEIMTRDEVAAWLKVRPRQIDRLGIPCLELGHKTKRYLVKDVAAWLEDARRGGTEVSKQHWPRGDAPEQGVERGSTCSVGGRF